MSRSTMKAVTFCLAAGLVLLGGFALKQTRQLQQLQLREQRSRELAAEELYAAVAALDTALEKCRYATGPELLVPLWAECSRQSRAASAALGLLPPEFQENDGGTAVFLSRAGEYTAALLQKAGAGEGCTEEDRAALALLSDHAMQLETVLARCRGTAAGDAAPMAALPVFDEERLPAPPEPEAPLARAAEISREDALLIGARFLLTRPNLVECLGRSEGDVPVWRIRSGDCTAHVSVHGGHALRILCDRAPGQSILTPEDGREKAREHLEDRDFGSMTEISYSIYDNILTVTYCYEADGVLCYPDAVTVSVYLDTGELAGLDAEAYIRAHSRPEPLPAAAVSAGEAAAGISPALEAVSRRLVLTAGADGTEQLCHEFLCINDSGRRYLLYVNAATGRQEDIRILREDAGGAHRL